MEKNLETLMDEIRLYQPWTEKETWEKQQILDFMEKNPDCLFRGNRIAHMTASAWVVNRQRTKVLMAYHKIYDSWAWLGGHADGEADLLQVAMKEACEEAGLRPAAAADQGPDAAAGSLRPVRKEIFSLETLTVDGHVKRGSWVPSHLHLNLTYLLEADEAGSALYTSGSLINVIFNFMIFMILTSVAALHLGQNNGNLNNTVSLHTLIRVLFLHIGHKTRIVLITLAHIPSSVSPPN